ncbi:MAG: aspartate kinase [Flavobacteriales bacterium]|tara:strand:- start:23331 stop:24473 length:1143 start_codon:yes stop_codon:yes gene_type:complete
MNTQTKVPPIDRIDLEKIKKKKINLVVFGHGTVGSCLIDQIISSQKEISRKRDLDVTIFGIANSTRILLERDGMHANWKEIKAEKGEIYTIREVIDFTKKNNLENLIAVDNTSSNDLVAEYPLLVANGFHLISSNKIGNTLALESYQNLRETLAFYKKEYLYETNVGAGLPLIDTIKLLHLSGENITRIKGVFSGSLSYIFNEFSEGNKEFSDVLREAINRGYTEPDPRIDLSGNDVAKKLLILARELDLNNEIEDVSVQNLIPKQLRNISEKDFILQLEELNVPYHIRRKNLLENQVLRYVGDLNGDLSKSDGAKLTVNLTTVNRNSSLGQLKGSDSIFEIYTESYGENPIVIQGAGAGAEVTARGVFGDILRLSEKIN